MRITNFVLAAAVLAACHHDAPPAQPTPTPATPAEPAKPADPTQMQQVTTTQPMSPSIAVSSDLVALCGIVAPTTAAGEAPTFDYDKDELTKDDRKVLDQIGTCLTTGAAKGRAVSLVGRADPRGTEEYNLGLGSRRANMVGGYLQRLGVTQPQLAVTTRGALDASGGDEAGWKKDRRVDIQLKQN
jgi:peptidoglycan-associated lipoprotein